MIGLSSGNLDTFIISLIENWITNDPEFKDFQLIVRPHPNTGKSLEGVGPKTIVNYPDVLEFTSERLTDREFTKKDLDIYAGLIAHSVVVVSYQGTSTIDTVALGRPVINIAFDEKPNLPFLVSMRHQYDYTHYRPVVASGGVKVVFNPEELRTAILGYERHPELDQKNRERLINEQCYKLDGLASRRIVDEVKKLLSI
jgi:hypothetical protein